MSVQRLTTLVLALFVLAATGCTPEEDWTSPEYVQYRLELGDQRAFAEFTRLSPEAQAAMVPTLVEVYNSGVRQENSLQALVSAGDARAKDVFLSALNRTDDNLAGLAARGLAAIGATDASTAVAQRLATVTQHDAYPAFLEALNAIPEGEQTLLDHTLLLACSGVSLGRTHALDEYPILYAGSGGGVFKQGMHYRSETRENASRVMLSCIRAMGILRSEFGTDDAQVTEGLGGIEV